MAVSPYFLFRRTYESGARGTKLDLKATFRFVFFFSRIGGFEEEGKYNMICRRYQGSLGNKKKWDGEGLERSEECLKDRRRLGRDPSLMGGSTTFFGGIDGKVSDCPDIGENQ